MKLLFEQEASTGGDATAYITSTIVQTSAPKELGSLRLADGLENVGKTIANGVSKGLTAVKEAVS